MKNIKINVENIDLSLIKQILWKLCYNPEEAMDELEYKVDNPKELINLILKECRNSSKELKFGDETPYLDTLGIDIGIKNPVVRDVILEHCYAAFEDEKCLEKIIKLLKTQENDNRDLYEKRIFGGLRALGFEIEEAKYLKDTCNLYPVALLLERMVTSHVSNKVVEETVSTDEVEKEVVHKKDEVILATKLLENQKAIENVLNVIDEMGNISSVRDISLRLTSLQNEISMLQNKLLEYSIAMKSVSKLEEESIHLEYIITKKDAIKNLFEAAIL